MLKLILYCTVLMVEPMSKTWTVVLEEDLATGELILPLPNELLASQGWEEGDNLVWDVRTDGSIVLSKQIISNN